MAFNSPGQQMTHGKPSLLEMNITSEADNIKGLFTLCDIFASSYGPQGHAKVVHNNCGGELLLTSSSNQLMSSITISKPILKLITTIIKEHVKTYSDGGLFGGMLCLKLVSNALAVNIHRHLIIEIYDLLLQECLNFMRSSEFSCRQDINDANNDIYLKLVKSMFLSKPACLLFHRDLDHICCLTVDGYRQVQVDNPAVGGAAKLLYVTVDGKPPTESRLLSGVLYECPHIPTYHQNAINLGTDSGDGISAVLVQQSMAGDSELFPDGQYELAAGLQLSDAILTQLTAFTDYLITAGVKVLFCQKVVHPKLKKLLSQNGVLILDRLGFVLFDAVHQLAGGVVLDPFSASARWQRTSAVGCLQHVVINNKSYIHVDGICQRQDGHYLFPVCTVILCHRTEGAVQEMKAVYERCQHVLSLTKKSQQILCGGGCWQTALCLYLAEKVPQLLSQWVDRLSCAEHLVLFTSQIFLTALQQTVLSMDTLSCHLLDKSTGHHFVSYSLSNSSKHCMCGAISCSDSSELIMVSDLHITKCPAEIGQGKHEESSSRHALSDIQVVDAYLPFVNAMKTAVTTSCMVLGIHNYIKDNE